MSEQKSARGEEQPQPEGPFRQSDPWPPLWGPRVSTVAVEVRWDTCAEDDCIGVRLPAAAWCLAHAHEQAPDACDAELKRIGEEGTVDLRGVPISAELLGRLLNAAPHEDNRPAFATCQFDGATFQDLARFGGVTFHGRAGFNEATFEDAAEFAGATFHDEARFVKANFHADAEFDGATFNRMTWFALATFQSDAGFDGATFHSEAEFSLANFQDLAKFAEATFHGKAGFSASIFHDVAAFEGAIIRGWADFVGVTFHKGAVFEEAAFQGRADFRGATFHAWANFEEATFHGEARFGGAAFHREARFDGAAFQRAARFDGAVFQGTARFRGVTFQQARQLGPMLVRKALVLDQAVFQQRAQIEVAAAAVCCQRTRFLAGVQLRVRYAQVVLDDADLAAPSILAGVPSFVYLDEERFARAWRRLRPAMASDDLPRLLSLRRADVAGLTVASVDLRACRFLGAHNLDKLQIEGLARFGYTRSAWQVRRQTIAEEHHWRAGRTRSAHRRGWYPAAYQPPAWLEVEPVTPEQVARLYRALRKGREDNKNEPGAAAFYFGEMEMRRNARHEKAKERRRDRDFPAWSANRTEHGILWLYWLVSGYGLRAWRALATFLAVLVVAASLFTFGGGFASSTTATVASPSATTLPASTSPPSMATTATADTSFGGALVYSARTVIGLTRDPQPRLTRFGDVVQILLRILGPVLLGLAVLSVRGRVKR